MTDAISVWQVLAVSVATFAFLLAVLLSLPLLLAALSGCARYPLPATRQIRRAWREAWPDEVRRFGSAHAQIRYDRRAQVSRRRDVVALTRIAWLLVASLLAAGAGVLILSGHRPADVTRSILSVVCAFAACGCSALGIKCGAPRRVKGHRRPGPNQLRSVA